MGSNEVLAVVKVYGSVPEDSRSESIWAVMADQLAALPRSTYEYSVNYGAPRRYDEAQLARSMRQFSDIEQLSVVSRDGASGAAATALLALRLPQRIYEFCVFTRTTEPIPRFVDIATRALRKIKGIYGYGRALRTDAAPLSEAVPKRSLFGEGVHVDPQTHVWKRDLTADDGLKGVYPFNIWSARVLNELVVAPVVAQHKAESIPLGAGFVGVLLSPDELAHVRASVPDLRDFVRP